MLQFVYPYIMSKDSRKQAEYYEKVFDAKTTYIMLGKDMPDCPKELLDSVMHLELNINDTMFYFADEESNVGDNIHLHLDYSDKELMNKQYLNMIKDSQIISELKDTFWGATYGVVKDQFDIVWHFHFMNRDA